ncbi:MAG TPA: CoA-binding protein, partial [Anaerolineales bacterium]|nr:CoA-binding protein [Anaerolineales bacterium]
MDKTLLPFFQPTGIVVLGVSTSSQKLGYGVARNLKASGYRGPIHLVGQRAGELFGQRVYSTIADIPGPADLAVIVVPAAAVAATIQQCGARGTHAAIVLTAGFRETGPAGAALERECLEQARIHGVRLLGPNCIGIIDTHFPFDTSFLQPPMPPKGGIAFVSQSGALC